MQRTPSGGLQYFYKGWLATTQNVIGKHLWLDGQSHVDTRGIGGAGGYVSLPPSRTALDAKAHTARGVYTWLNDLPFAPLPQWIIDMCAAPSRDDNAQPQEPLVDWDLPENIEWVIDHLRNDAQPAIEGRGGELATLKQPRRSRIMASQRIERSN